MRTYITAPTMDKTNHAIVCGAMGLRVFVDEEGHARPRVAPPGREEVLLLIKGQEQDEVRVGDEIGEQVRSGAGEHRGAKADDLAGSPAMERPWVVKASQQGVRRLPSADGAEQDRDEQTDGQAQRDETDQGVPKH